MQVTLASRKVTSATTSPVLRRAEERPGTLHFLDALEVLLDLVPLHGAAEACVSILETFRGNQSLLACPLDTDARCVQKTLSVFLERLALDDDRHVEDRALEAALERHVQALKAKAAGHGGNKARHGGRSPSSVSATQEPFSLPNGAPPGCPLGQFDSVAPMPPEAKQPKQDNSFDTDVGGASGCGVDCRDCTNTQVVSVPVEVEVVIREASLFSRVLRLPAVPRPSEGGLVRRLFLAFDDSSKSLLGMVIASIVSLAIAVSTVSFVMESMPSFRDRPPECADRRARGLPLRASDCEPRPYEAFHAVEAICIAIFTVDYLARMLTVHALPASSQEVGGRLARTWGYFRQPLNIVDLLAIIPFYVRLALGGGAVGVVRVLRLARICRVFKLAKLYPGVGIFGDVMVMSGKPLFILFFFNVIIVLIFSSLIYFAEGQSFSVAPEFTQAAFPTGVYVRKDKFLEKDVVSPFASIPYSVWWVCVTLTTVGYGDYAPTTVIGKVIGVACFYTGVLFLALPISILGNNFEVVYNRHLDKAVKRLGCYQASHGRSGVASRQTRFTALVTEWLPQGSTLRRKIFILFEDPGASRLGKIMSIVIMVTILSVTVSFVMESMAAFKQTPKECSPQRLTVEDCEPRPHFIFHTIELVGIVIFTIDYVCRVATVHVATPEECGVDEKFYKKPLLMTCAYCMLWLNLIDLSAILPFYAQLLTGGGSSGGISVLRILRLIRIFRVLKMPKLNSGVTMLMNVILDSLPALGILFFMTLLMCVFLASCVLIAEGSNYSVDHFQEDHPDGCYIRPTPDGYGVEVSPFRSIPYAFWWFFATSTTVGYGDDYPTTTGGRVVGVLTFYMGIILLAMPITIIGGNFSNYYPSWVESMQVESMRVESMQPSSVDPFQSPIGADSPGGDARSASQLSPAWAPKP